MFEGNPRSKRTYVVSHAPNLEAGSARHAFSRTEGRVQVQRPEQSALRPPTIAVRQQDLDAKLAGLLGLDMKTYVNPAFIPENQTSEDAILYAELTAHLPAEPGDVAIDDDEKAMMQKYGLL